MQGAVRRTAEIEEAGPHGPASIIKNPDRYPNIAPENSATSPSIPEIDPTIRCR